MLKENTIRIFLSLQKHRKNQFIFNIIALKIEMNNLNMVCFLI